MGVSILFSDSLLEYTPTPDPDPLTVSDQDPARLDITVGTRGGGSAYCKSIAVRIRIGDGADALTANRAQLTSAGPSGWTARPGYADGVWQVFEFVPARPVLFNGQSVTVTVSQIAVNAVPGNAEIEIVEEASPTDGSYTPKTVRATVAKFPAQFVFRNFRPTKVMVGNGEKAVLKWDGSADAQYTMFWDRTSRDVSSVREWPTPEPLTAPTGFMLQAKVTSGGQTLTHTLTTVVMVERPDLDVAALQVWGSADFRGDVSGLMELPPARPFHELVLAGTKQYAFTAAASGLVLLRVAGTLNQGWHANSEVLGPTYAKAAIWNDGAASQFRTATALCPIWKGTRVTLSVSGSSGIADGRAEFWWIPFGKVASPVA
ncbi:hypothetical protein ABH926_008513 [Catenulispora sp. GP43]|uniref:hypothetical protein n=1 Tax=Catenulispora sp. GP43 TaxID=3156263 RepID=UPI00351792F1